MVDYNNFKSFIKHKRYNTDFPNVALRHHYISSLSVDTMSNNIVDLTYNNKTDSNVSVEVLAQILVDNLYEVILNFVIICKFQDDVLYKIDLQYKGFAEVINVPVVDDQSQVEDMEKILKFLLTVEVPTEMLPEVRNIILNLTRYLGSKPILFDKIDFYDIYMKSMEDDNK